MKSDCILCVPHVFGEISPGKSLALGACVWSSCVIGVVISHVDDLVDGWEMIVD